MEDISSTIMYDLRGLRCPLPVLKIRKKLKNLLCNDILEVLTDDSLAPLDIEHFCKSYGYHFRCLKADSFSHIFIQKTCDKKI